MQLSKVAEKVILELGTDKFERTLFSQNAAFDGYIISFEEKKFVVINDELVTVTNRTNDPNAAAALLLYQTR